MPAMVIRKLEESIKIRLRLRAAQNDRSMEEEVRVILRTALGENRAEPNLAELASSLFGPKHGVNLTPHPPVRARKPPKLT
jgi:antitoxin FitA